MSAVGGAHVIAIRAYNHDLNEMQVIILFYVPNLRSLSSASLKILF